MRKLNEMRDMMRTCEVNAKMAAGRLLAKGMKKEPGLDGILVTVGLCIIALLLCVVMKEELADFVKELVDAMTLEAQEVLTGVTP